jgi:tRNA dimethylallyltransferase
MYLRALTQGISALPDVAPEARAEARALQAALAQAGLHAGCTPRMRDLRPSDAQRIARALSLAGAAGALAHWQRAARCCRRAPRFRAILLDPPRDALRAAIATLAPCCAGGARARWRAAARPRPRLPRMRAHGVPELAAPSARPSDAEASRAPSPPPAPTPGARHLVPPSALVSPPPAHRINARFTGPAQFSKRESEEIMSFVDGRC